MVSMEFVFLFESLQMYILTNVSCSLIFHVPQMTLLASALHHGLSGRDPPWLSLCPVSLDLERGDLIGNWLENELATLG